MTESLKSFPRAPFNKTVDLEKKEMKQFIVLCSTIVLGIAIYNMIMGPDSSSVMSTVTDVWQQGVLVRTDTP